MNRVVEQLLDRIKDATQDLTDLFCLGPQADPKILAFADKNVLEAGRPLTFWKSTEIPWYFSQSALRDALLDKLEDAGCDIRKANSDALALVERAKKFACLETLELLEGENLPSGPSVVIKDSGTPIRYLNHGVRTVRLLRLDPEATRVNAALLDLDDAIRSLARTCIETGRVFAVCKDDGIFEFVTPARFKTASSNLKRQCRFVIGVDFAPLVCARKSGKVSDVAVANVKRAQAAIAELYAGFERTGKRSVKTDLEAVFTQAFDISKERFEQNVWGPANIPRWKKGGTPREGLKLNQREIRQLLRDTQNP